MLLSRLEGFLALWQVEGGTLPLHHPVVVPVALALLQCPSTTWQQGRAVGSEMFPHTISTPLY